MNMFLQQKRRQRYTKSDVGDNMACEEVIGAVDEDGRASARCVWKRLFHCRLTAILLLWLATSLMQIGMVRGATLGVTVEAGGGSKRLAYVGKEGQRTYFTTDVDWIHLSKSSVLWYTSSSAINGIFNDSIEYTIDKNPSSQLREGRISVTGSVSDFVAVVLQYGGGASDDTSPDDASDDTLPDDASFVVRNGVLLGYEGVLPAKIIIPSNVTSIGERAFYGCSWLTSVTIPSSVTSIWAHAFYGCSRLTSVTIPSTVTSIEEYAFYGCSGFTSVTISSGVTSIGDYAFGGCSGLTSLTLPSSVSRVGTGAFDGCSGLTSVMIHEGVKGLPDFMFYGCRSLQSVTLPSSLTDVGEYTFYGCVSLASVTIPSNVASIGGRAFNGCSSLKSLSIPSSVTNVGAGVCCTCTALTQIEVEAENAAYRTINNCLVTIEGKKLVAVPLGCAIIDLPADIEEIPYAIFSNDAILKSIIIPSKVSSIGKSAFSGCSELTTIKIPKSVLSIGSSAFSGCSGLEVVYVSNGDTGRVKGLYDWPSEVEFVEFMGPAISDDPVATVTGDAETGFVIKPSDGKIVVEVTIPQGVDAAKVTVEISTKVVSVKPNGAKVKIVSGGADITGFLNMPAADGNGIVDLTKATVKEEIVKEAMDPAKGAEIKLDAADPKLMTPNTRKGLFYQLREGETLDGMKNGDSKVGDGQPWFPEIKVKGGNSAFYSIGVGKGE